jgi:methenyltetrahydrofolate cyclohydrolase
MEPEPLLDRPLARFLENLADRSPIPGGGSAAAVVTAMAAGLLAMAARASTDSWPEARGVAAQAEALRDRAAPLGELDASAYAEALALLDEQGEPEAQERRDFRLGTALSRAAALPLAISEAAADVAELGVLVVEHADASRRPDAVAAILLADAAVNVGAQLVRANLTTHAQDDRVARADELVEATAAAVGRVLGES